MKNFFILSIFLVCFASCKKTIEAAKEDLVIKAMTDGQWRVTRFIKGSADRTADFTPYKFQFKANRTVEAINVSSIESIGTWDADAANRTISSTFVNATPTISLLNGTWQITNNSWTFVEATQSVNNEVLTLRLDK
jgi:hypothetical protein